MAAFFSLTLAVSIVGLVLLLVLKHYEMTTGHRMLGGLRPRLDRFFHHTLMFVERGAPGALRTLLLRLGRAVRRGAQQVLARAILLFEYNLERILHVVRQKSQAPPSEGGASHFLQEVAAHKQKLLRRSPKNRAIFEE